MQSLRLFLLRFIVTTFNTTTRLSPWTNYFINTDVTPVCASVNVLWTWQNNFFRKTWKKWNILIRKIWKKKNLNQILKRKKKMQNRAMTLDETINYYCRVMELPRLVDIPLAVFQDVCVHLFFFFFTHNTIFVNGFSLYREILINRFRETLWLEW